MHLTVHRPDRKTVLSEFLQLKGYDPIDWLVYVTFSVTLKLIIAFMYSQIYSECICFMKLAELERSLGRKVAESHPELEDPQSIKLVIQKQSLRGDKEPNAYFWNSFNSSDLLSRTGKFNRVKSFASPDTGSNANNNKLELHRGHADSCSSSICSSKAGGGSINIKRSHQALEFTIAEKDCNSNASKLQQNDTGYVSNTIRESCTHKEYKEGDWKSINGGNYNYDQQINYKQAATAGYTKSNYAVLVGSSVKEYDTGLFAALPCHNTFIVKEKQKDSYGVTRVKLVLKSTDTHRFVYMTWHSY